LLKLGYPLSTDSSFDPAQFDLTLIVKKALAENDIYQVYDREAESRIGWCFPLQALNSTEHSYADNEHFLPYAYVAALKILRECPANILTRCPNINDKEEFSFNDFFPEDVAALVISRAALKPNVHFDISDWIPSLFIYGYVPLGSRDTTSLVSFGNKPADVRMTIRSVSSHLRNLPFISAVFSDIVAFEKDSLFNFFYSYQLIELLLAQIFKAEQQVIVDNLIVVRNDVEKTKGFLQKYSDCTSEKQRLKLLLNNYLDSAPDQASLRDVCNNFLAANNKSPCDNVASSLYSVRNILFHQYRDVKQLSFLDSIVSEFAPFMVKLLQEFTGIRKN
jgi:hypothetical protein